ncbi:outer membrane protein with beta-barrel domain [Mucilaginibacter gracilis]|uniref:Outer membrane protein with beta-barrel domain n=1 Tax=Mucilaginibacter gracilis TaxID=423350 RepID=A0A495IVZ0_9SPHI|nr:porin family protein [Mucilaginibacter gracilis]RKR80917.1 outer membrane protein with beta-barrel domain [Mucilaginibacter gracilis]
MKRILLTLVTLVVISTGTKAQFVLGLKGGVNVSKINTDNFTQSSMAGYLFGAFARIGKGLYLEPEIYASSKGGQFNYDANGTTAGGNAKVRFTTLDVPVLIGQSFGASSFNIRAMVGPVYSYVLDRNTTFSDNLGAAYRDLGDYNHSTLGYQAGLGIDLGNIALDARYEGGLTSINQKYGERPNLWSFSIGFKIL